MFRGCTTIIMNEATLIEAAQEWLDKRVNPAEGPQNKVTSIRQPVMTENIFRVELREEEKKP